MGKKISYYVKLNVLEKYNKRCAYCGCKLDFETMQIDHIKPIFRRYTVPPKERGTNTIDNYNPCCMSCNSSKYCYSIEEWRIRLSEKLDDLAESNSTYRLLKRYGMIKEIRKPVVFYFERVEG